MKPKNIILFLFFLFFIKSFSQPYTPGGVGGAEIWYIVNHDNLTEGIYPNQSLPHIKLFSCLNYDKDFFNFNPSIKATPLCLFYDAVLENTTSRNVFFVGEQFDGSPYSHVTTEWNPLVTGLYIPDSIARNRFDVSTKDIYINKNALAYQRVDEANVNFYHWNLYQTDKKFRSYGLGETRFYIGKAFTNEVSEAADFIGNFPEFISFPFELTANQKLRVESYLALKYGITLSANTSYRSAINIIFWNSSNNGKFPNRIFGIGRDNISNLNQLQSESVHNKDYLIASVGELVETNQQKQEIANIINENFIVFGDNGEATELGQENDFNTRTLNRVWLSQNTGTGASTIPMFFKINLQEAMKTALAENTELRLWMLHDKFAGSDEVSDFNSHDVEYYEPVGMEEYDYGFFADVKFDTDSSTHDQFTFGVGPKMIVQIRLDDVACRDKAIPANVVITGGVAPYDVNISNSGTYNEDFNTQENTVAFDADRDKPYTAYVKDAEGNSMEVMIQTPPGAEIGVDLGPDQILNVSQPLLSFDAGIDVQDPSPTYQWYFNGVLMEHTDPKLDVDQPGEYTVVITVESGCQETDTINVSYNFTGTITADTDCEIRSGTIYLNLEGGIAPFTTRITGGSRPINEVYNTQDFMFPVDFGEYTVNTRDSSGNVFTETVVVEDPLGGMELDLISQLQQVCYSIIDNYDGSGYPIADCNVTSFTLDASVLVTNPNATYEWFLDEISLSVNNPMVTIVNDSLVSATIKEFSVKVTNAETGCYTTETFLMKGSWVLNDGVQNRLAQNSTAENNVNDQPVKEDDEKEKASKLITKVYPNPSDSNTTFYYEVSSTEVFDGTVEIYSSLSTILYEVPVSGKSSYILSFNLLSSGVYFISTKTNGIIVTDRIIIK